MLRRKLLLISRQDQLFLPMHTHIIKAEDIISNRGGATLIVELFGSDDQGNFAEDRGGVVYCDGSSGANMAQVRNCGMLAPGESVTLMPGDWHAFWGEGGDVLLDCGVQQSMTLAVFRTTSSANRLADLPILEEDVDPMHLWSVIMQHGLNRDAPCGLKNSV